MSINTTNGILDITGAVVRVSKMEFKQATGFDTVFNNIARNTILLSDSDTYETTTTYHNWALKLPNAWVFEADVYLASGTSGGGDHTFQLNFYNNVNTAITNGYTLGLDGTSLTLSYDGTQISTATLSASLNDDAWHKLFVLFERDTFAVAIDGKPEYTFTDSVLRDRVYNDDTGYVVFYHEAGVARKIKNLKFVNGDKWIRESGSSNIAYIGGSVGIGTHAPKHTLDVLGNANVGALTVTSVSGDGSGLSLIQSSNVSDFASNVTRIGTLETDLDSNATRIGTLETDLGSNVTRIGTLESGDLTIGGEKTFSSNIEVGTANLFVDTTTGRVGVGTESPGTLLELSKATGSATISPTELRLSTTTNAADWNVTDPWARLSFYTDDVTGDAPGVMASVGAVASSADGGENTRLAFFTAEPHLERMCIDRYGSVGIGTVSPEDNLHIYSNESGGTQLKIQNANTEGDTRAGLFLQTRSSNVFSMQFTPSTETTIFDNKGQGGYSFYQKDSGGTTNLAMQITKDGNVGIGTATPAYTLDVDGTIGVSGKKVYSMVKWDIDLTGLSNTNFYPIEFTHGITSSGDHHPINFKIFGESLGGGDPFNENTLVGYARGGGYSDHNAIYDVHINRFSNTEHRFQGVYEGTADYTGGFVIYMRGGYDYGVITDADEVVKHTTAYTTSLHPNASTFAIKNSGGTDVSGTSALIFQLVNLAANERPVERFTYGDFNISGNVGIGTASPATPLHIESGTGTVFGQSYMTLAYFHHNSTGLTRLSNSKYLDNIGIYSRYDICTRDEFVAVNGTIGGSDRRIKRDIVDVDDGSALETLRLLKPKRYKYRDVVNKGDEQVWGFIAQEVEDVLPYATKLKREVLPNIYELANVSSSNVITFTDFNTSNLEANATTIQVMTKDGTEERATIAEVLDERTIRVEEDLTDWIGSVDETGNVVAGNQLFMYGQEVDDFVFLKKDAIWTVATAALQEVDRQFQAEKARNDALETQVADLLARITALENS